MAVLWALREPLAFLVLGDAERATEVGILGVALVLTLLAASQTALLQGMRRIGDLARVSVIGGLAGTAAGLAAVWLMGEDGVVWFLVAMPVVSVLTALVYTRRLPRAEPVNLGAAEASKQWRAMVGLGVVFMAGGLLTSATLLLVRAMITQDLGMDAAGQFHAAWIITIQYVGFLLGAMAADYYPRLTETIRDRVASIALVNDQAQIGLALGGPILLAMIGLAPWVLQVLYTAEFGDAAALLQWQSLGNVLKLAAWPIAFILVASARSGLYFGVELSWNAMYLLLVWTGLSVFGLEVAGIAFALAYGGYFAILWVVVRRVHEFEWQKTTLGLIALHAISALALVALAYVHPPAAAAVAIAAAGVTGVFGLRLVVRKTGTGGRLGGRVAAAYGLVGWPLERRDAR
jgi:O-antigen/teichoic acid export membrane protein